MSNRYIVYVNDDNGIHTPSKPIANRREAEVFAAHRSRFRRDAFVIVALASDTHKRWLVAYRAGFLQDTHVIDPFNPERVQIQVVGGACIYALVHKEAS